jgi:hypothetical protein
LNGGTRPFNKASGYAKKFCNFSNIVTFEKFFMQNRSNSNGIGTTPAPGKRGLMPEGER